MEDDKNKLKTRLKKSSTSMTDLKAGMRLKQARELLGMTQKDLAESLKIRVKPELIQQYEEGEISVTSWRLSELAEVLGVHTDYFFPDHKIATNKTLYSELNMRMITNMNRLPIDQQQAILSVLSAFSEANKTNKASKANGAKN